MSGGQPFARLAAPAAPSRPRVAIAVFMLVPVPVVISGAAVLTADAVLGPRDLTDPAFLLVATLVVPVGWLIVATLTARYVLRIHPASALSVAGHFRWRRYARCMAAAVLVGGALSAAQFGSIGDAGPTASRWPLVLAVVVLCVPVQAFAEEYVFRGVLTLAIGARFARRGAAVAVPIVVTSVLFAAVHPHPDLVLAVLVLVGGVGYAVLTHLTGGLEAASAAHTVWNAGPLVAAGVFGMAPSTIGGPQMALAVLGEIAIVALLVLVARADRAAAPVSPGRAAHRPPAPRGALGCSSRPWPSGSRRAS